MDHFIEEDADIKHLLVLADSGTGKTTFVLNYYAHNARKPSKKAHRLAIVPLGVEEADNAIAEIPDPEKKRDFPGRVRRGRQGRSRPPRADHGFHAHV